MSAVIATGIIRGDKGMKYRRRHNQPQEISRGMSPAGLARAFERQSIDPIIKMTAQLALSLQEGKDRAYLASLSEEFYSEADEEISDRYLADIGADLNRASDLLTRALLRAVDEARELVFNKLWDQTPMEMADELERIADYGNKG